METSMLNNYRTFGVGDLNLGMGRSWSDFDREGTKQRRERKIHHSELGCDFFRCLRYFVPSR